MEQKSLDGSAPTRLDIYVLQMQFWTHEISFIFDQRQINKVTKIVYFLVKISYSSLNCLNQPK